MLTPQAIEVKDGAFALKDGCKVFLPANADLTADIINVFAYIFQVGRIACKK